MSAIAVGEITIVDLHDEDVHIGTTAPAELKDGRLWLDTSTVPNVMKRWDAATQKWIKASPTEASDIGAETPSGAQDKADGAEDAAKTYASSQADAAKTYSDEILQALADGTYGGGVFIDGNKIMAPELYGAKIEGVDIKGASGTFDGFRLGLPQYAHIEASGGVPYPFEELGSPNSVSGSATVRGAAENVFDGDPNTYWYGETGIIYDAAVMFDYNEPVCIKKVVAQAPTKGQVPETITRTMTLQYRDGSTWKSVGKVDLPRGENGESFVNPNSIFSTKWRLVNFWVLGILNYAGIMDVKLYGGVLDEAAATIKGYTGSIAGNQKSFELSGAGAFLRSDYFFIDDQPAMEKGENFNGSWVRWSNGLQVCWGLNTFPGDGWSGSGDKWYLQGQSLTFPIAFNSAPTFLGTTRDAQVAMRSAKLAFFSVGTSNVSKIAFNGWGTSPDNFSLYWLAIGRWK